MAMRPATSLALMWLLSSDTAVIGAHYADVAGSNAGLVYVYTFNGTAWNETQILQSADLTAGDIFGYAVDIHNDTILVSARLDDDNGRNSNSAYPFTYNGRTWNESAKLTAADGQVNDYFNWSVVLTIGVTLDIDAYVANDGTMTQTIPISAGQSAANLTIANPQPAVSETVKITLNVVTGTAVIQNTFPNTLHNPLNLTLTFIDPVQGDSLCSLCFVDWLLKLLGFDTSFWMLYHMTLTDLQASDAWPYYHNLFNQHTAELTTIMATNPTVLWHTYDALGTWTPAIAAADNGNGSSFVVSQQMADEAILTLEGIRDNVSPALAAQIQVEIDVLDPNDMVRQTMDDVFVQVENRIQGQVYLPFISK